MFNDRKMVKSTTAGRPRAHFRNTVAHWVACLLSVSCLVAHSRVRSIDTARIESFTTHKHLVLHAPRIGAAGPDARRERGVMVARSEPRITTMLHSHPHPPWPPRAITSPRGTPSNTPRVTVHTQNRYVLINVWTWCRAEASLPPIRLIVLQSSRRILFACTPRLADASVDYAISADNQAWRPTARRCAMLCHLCVHGDYS